MTNEEVLIPIINKFYDKIIKEDFVTDKTGCKIVELICEKIELNPFQPILDFSVRKTNVEYCKKELEWYLSQDLSVKKIGKNAKMWFQVCSRKKKVNSNYGWCVFSKKNYNQYDNCLRELINNKDTRRAAIIYNRPSMWRDYKQHGMNDFICTFYSQFFIRDNKLICIHSMRSNDFFFFLGLLMIFIGYLMYIENYLMN